VILKTFFGNAIFHEIPVAAVVLRQQLRRKNFRRTPEYSRKTDFKTDLRRFLKQSGVEV